MQNLYNDVHTYDKQNYSKSYDSLWKRKRWGAGQEWNVSWSSRWLWVVVESGYQVHLSEAGLIVAQEKTVDDAYGDLPEQSEDYEENTAAWHSLNYLYILGSTRIRLRVHHVSKENKK